ncbi:hypothetical protein KM043_002648 [Ampulex compressa]|nr:hypothetical protein KM043_002648 [Ampulex compressa]
MEDAWAGREVKPIKQRGTPSKRSHFCIRPSSNPRDFPRFITSTSANPRAFVSALPGRCSQKNEGPRRRRATRTRYLKVSSRVQGLSEAGSRRGIGIETARIGRTGKILRTAAISVSGADKTIAISAAAEVKQLQMPGADSIYGAWTVKLAGSP